MARRTASWYTMSDPKPRRRSNRSARATDAPRRKSPCCLLFNSATKVRASASASMRAMGLSPSARMHSNACARPSTPASECDAEPALGSCLNHCVARSKSSWRARPTNHKRSCDTAKMQKSAMACSLSAHSVTVSGKPLTRRASVESTRNSESQPQGISTRRVPFISGSRRNEAPSSATCFPAAAVNANSDVVTKSSMAVCRTSLRTMQSVHGAPPTLPRLAAAASACVSGGAPLKKRKRANATREPEDTLDTCASSICCVWTISFKNPSLMTNTLKAPPSERTLPSRCMACAISVVLPRFFTSICRSSPTVGSRPLTRTLSAVLSKVMRCTGSWAWYPKRSSASGIAKLTAHCTVCPMLGLRSSTQTTRGRRQGRATAPLAGWTRNRVPWAPRS
mmetsp:Transcript_44445/g.117987  ORF Transcript_44445/g.117987 Transcript_44445/m.117987 type:complete len:395 (+) Transcript_44445:2850-4034(+)